MPYNIRFAILIIVYGFKILTTPTTHNYHHTY